QYQGANLVCGVEEAFLKRLRHLEIERLFAAFKLAVVKLCLVLFHAEFEGGSASTQTGEAGSWAESNFLICGIPLFVLPKLINGELRLSFPVEISEPQNPSKQKIES